VRFYCFKNNSDSDLGITPKECVDCDFLKDKCRNVMKSLTIVNIDEEWGFSDYVPPEFQIIMRSRFVPIGKTLIQFVYHSAKSYERQEVIDIYNDMAFRHFKKELPYEEYADYQI